MTCQTCKFAMKSAQQLNVYECRRHPPCVLAVQGAQGVGFAAAFPAVGADCWCGEYQPVAIAKPAQRAATKMDA